MKRIVRTAALLLGVLCFFSAVCFAEKLDLEDADFVFVDAQGATGYYVDMNSVRLTSDHEAVARVEIVKAKENHMFVYSMRFNRQKKTYQILTSLHANYDTKEKTGGSMVPMKEVGYAPGSPMESIVEFIYHPQS